MEERFVSADSHVLEPGDLWTSRAPNTAKDRVLRVVTDQHGKSHREGEGLTYQPLAMAFAAGRRGDDFKNEEETPWEQRPAAGYEWQARLDAMSADGVAGEVIYPTLGMGLYRLTDPDLKLLQFEVYNEWLSEFTAGSNGRLLGVAMVSVDDPTTVARQISRARELGHQGIMIPAAASQPYNDPIFEPVWAAAAEARMPISLHVGTGVDLLRTSGPGAAGINYLTMSFDLQQTCQALIWSGALQRYPDLRVVFVENGIGWISQLLERMDDVWEQHRGWMKPRLTQPPSHYFSHQCAATFERDRVGILTREVSGVRPLMWATDYPHAESSWPESRKTAEAALHDVPEDERGRITHKNVEELYNWNPNPE